jgi:GNAT superfamily N-acetyltransferase
LDLIYRNALEGDLPALVHMLADDNLGRNREDSSTTLNPKYIDAFKGISSDPNNELIVVCNNCNIVGMLQLTFIPYLTYIGSWRCLVEGVRIHSGYRGHGLGKSLFEWAISRAQERNCHLIQLTSDKTRPDALRFYESLGFVASHEGFKLHFR